MAYVRDGILHDYWHICDVKDLDESLTDAACIEVLERVADYHDAEVGINWDVIQIHIDGVKQAAKK